MAVWKKPVDGGIDATKTGDLDDFFSRTQYLGSVDRAVSNNMYGLDHEGVKGLVPENRDNYGMVFFTRPQLNLTEVNIANIPDLYSYLNEDKASVHMYVRNMLDPRLHLSSKGGISSSLVDHQMAFIPVMTNNIKSLSGWPDTVAGTYTSSPGVRKQEWTIIDSNVDIGQTFDLDATFRNTMNEPIVNIMRLWVKVASGTYENMMSKYFDYILANRIDYNTRIYRLVLDSTKRYVQKIAATGVAFPVNIPDGRMFDFTDSGVYNDQNKDLNFRFKCTVAEYNKDITMHEFNLASSIFNPDLRKLTNGEGSGSLVKIPHELLGNLNYRGYPFINPDTSELEWYISKNSASYKSLVAIKS